LLQVLQNASGGNAGDLLCMTAALARGQGKTAAIVFFFEGGISCVES
jgi:hypothetical protein